MMKKKKRGVKKEKINSKKTQNQLETNVIKYFSLVMAASFVVTFTFFPSYPHIYSLSAILLTIYTVVVSFSILKTCRNVNIDEKKRNLMIIIILSGFTVLYLIIAINKDPLLYDYIIKKN